MLPTRRGMTEKSATAEHAWENGHPIKWKNTCVLDQASPWKKHEMEYLQRRQKKMGGERCQDSSHCKYSPFSPLKLRTRTELDGLIKKINAQCSRLHLSPLPLDRVVDQCILCSLPWGPSSWCFSAPYQALATCITVLVQPPTVGWLTSFVISCITIISALGVLEANAIHFRMGQLLDVFSDELNAFIHCCYMLVHEAGTSLCVINNSYHWIAASLSHWCTEGYEIPMLPYCIAPVSAAISYY